MAERKEKSLGLLAQRFVQMLLCVDDNQAVALEDAAKSLLGGLWFITLCYIICSFLSKFAATPAVDLSNCCTIDCEKQLALMQAVMNHQMTSTS